ncbi:DUF3558 domain-containing protein [Nocardia sp. 004]|uniref:DUF3558 domain-containing protein n=1 Tax=Nocardia sp. 004 TaxID=3385978 RepID=UPI0039A27BD6
MRGSRALIPVSSALVLAAGCGTSSEGDAGSVDAVESGTALAEQAPSGFDPCTDIPKSVLDSERLRVASLPNSADYNGGGGIKWRGCRWVVPDSYAAGITTTNLTVERVRANPKLTIRDEYVIDGRQAIATNVATRSNPRSTCTLNVEMRGGSLEFSLDNPDSRRETGHMDTCVLAQRLAEKVVPLIPHDA